MTTEDTAPASGPASGAATGPDRGPPPWRLRAWPWAVLVLAGVMVALEALSELADAGLIGSPLWRSLAVQSGAFWPGLLSGWRPNFPGQPLTMFVTYVFLHAGPGHLFGNLLVIGLTVPDLARGLGRRPSGRLMTVWVAAQLGGGLGFWALHAGPQPMIGASGVAFGLVIALQMIRAAEDRAAGRPGRGHRRLAGAVVGLSLINAASWLMLGGQLAWETHLGGMLGGMAGCWLVAPRPARPVAQRPAPHR